MALSVTKYNDFIADNIGIEIIKALYENDFPYLEIIEKGKAELFGFDSGTEKDLTNTKLKRTKMTIQFSGAKKSRSNFYFEAASRL